MVRQVTIKASEGYRNFGQLIKRVYRSDEHLIVERDGYAVAVIMSSGIRTTQPGAGRSPCPGKSAANAEPGRTFWFGQACQPA